MAIIQGAKGATKGAKGPKGAKPWEPSHGSHGVFAKAKPWLLESSSDFSYAEEVNKCLNLSSVSVDECLKSHALDTKRLCALQDNKEQDGRWDVLLSIPQICGKQTWQAVPCLACIP